MSSGIIVDVWRSGDDVMQKIVSTHDGKRQVKIIQTKKMPVTWYYQCRGWPSSKYPRTDFKRGFTDDYSSVVPVVGVQETLPSQLQYAMRLLPYNQHRVWNTNVDVVTQFLNPPRSTKIPAGLFDIASIETGELLERGNSVCLKACVDTFNIYCIHVEIEVNDRRGAEEPISSWKYRAEHYKMDYYEMCDEPTQAIKKISFAKCTANLETFENVYCFAVDGKNELETIEQFMDVFEKADIDMLLCWKYDQALEYIKERYVECGGNEKRFRLSVYHTDEKLEQVKVENLKFDAPVSYQYVSVFYIYHHLGGRSKCPGGYSPSSISKYYGWNGDLWDIEKTRRMFVEQHYFQWVYTTCHFFGFTHRNMLESYAKRLLVYMYRFCGKEYIFESTYVCRQVNQSKYKGGSTLELLTGKHVFNTEIIPVDIERAYTSIMLEYNICPTSMTWSELKNEMVNGDHEDEKVDETTTTTTVSSKSTRVEIEPDDTMKRKLENDVIYFVPATTHRGVYSRIVMRLADARKERQLEQAKYSHMSKEYQQYKVEGDLFKTFGNGLYGITKSPGPFYKPMVAIAIAKIGRRIFDELKNGFERNGVQIIAGDTDGQMLRGDQKVIDECIRNFHSRYTYIRVKKEKTLDRILFISKKNYYAVRGEEFISKGGIGTSRDMAYLTKTVCSNVAKMILESTDPDWLRIVECVCHTIDNARSDSLQLDQFDLGIFKPIPPKTRLIDFRSQTCGKLRSLIDIVATLKGFSIEWVNTIMKEIADHGDHLIQ